MKKLIMGIIGLSLIASAVLYAANRKNMLVFRSLGEKIREYSDTNIHPQLDEWKTIIDKKLNKDDLEKLNKLRAEAKEMQENMMKKMQDMRQNSMMGRPMGMDNQNNGGKPQYKKDFRETMKNNRKMINEKRDEWKDQLEVIIDKYPDFFDDLFDKVEKKQEIWKDDLAEIKDNWKKENKDVLEEMKNGRGKRMDRMDMMERKFKNPEHILLWDGAPERPEMPPMPNDMNMQIETSNSPNPFSETTNIKMDIPEDGDYKIEVINSSGNSIEILHNGYLNSGAHSFSFTAKDLKPGVYFYKISGNGIEQTNKMMLSK